jgi:hypothetical protein
MQKNCYWVVSVNSDAGKIIRESVTKSMPPKELERHVAEFSKGQITCVLAHLRMMCALYAFKLEYDWSQSVNAAVDGNALLFEPWKVAAERQKSYIAID